MPRVPERAASVCIMFMTNDNANTIKISTFVFEHPMLGICMYLLLLQ